MKKSILVCLFALIVPQLSFAYTLKNNVTITEVASKSITGFTGITVKFTGSMSSNENCASTVYWAFDLSGSGSLLEQRKAMYALLLTAHSQGNTVDIAASGCAGSFPAGSYPRIVNISVE